MAREIRRSGGWIMSIDLADWIDEVSGTNWVWFLKRLSANDTLANGTHQAGPYIPKDFLFTVFPSLNHPEKQNPNVKFELVVDSHSDFRNVRAIWYNNKLHGKTRNETRITGFGGVESALLDPESTGSLAVFSFRLDGNAEAGICHVWVCRNALEEDLIEERTGTVEPGKWKIWTKSALLAEKEKTCARGTCWLQSEEIPAGWLEAFPSGAEIVRKAIELRPDFMKLDPDHRLIKRRDCEYEMFLSLEEAVELPVIRRGFSSIEEFVSRAQGILQRRKTRSGRSLELHTKGIFIEERLEEGKDFSYQPESEPGKRPDFLFPSENVYKNSGFNASRLRMLAVKTTLKDRWRQILDEADRIETKHLLTMQEGVSENQFREIQRTNVCLVVPSPLIESYPKSVRPYLSTLESFMDEVRILRM